MKENVYLASKPRYEILDGLRGVASVIVVLFHLLETYSAGPAYQRSSIMDTWPWTSSSCCPALSSGMPMMTAGIA